MRTMYVPGSETHVHSDYIIGHHHTMLKINSGKYFNYTRCPRHPQSLLHNHNVRHNYQSAEKRKVDDKPTQEADWGFATKIN